MNLLGQQNVNLPDNNFQTDVLVKDRFNFHLAFVKSYVRYMQEVEGKGYEQAREDALNFTNKLIEKYSFGSKFLSSVESYLRMKYRPIPISFRNDVVSQSGIDDSLLLTKMFKDLKNSAEFAMLPSQFKMVM